MEINAYTIEKITDPTGILSGDRYEFRLDITLDEEDELFSEGGTGVRAILVVDGDQERIASAHFFERATDHVLDFELEEDEQAVVLEFCKSHLGKE